MSDLKVQVLVISRPKGDNVSVHYTDESRKAVLHQYVKDNWSREYGHQPSDMDEATEVYFDHTDDESFNWDIFDIQGAEPEPPRDIILHHHKGVWEVSDGDELLTDPFLTREEAEQYCKDEGLEIMTEIV
jgi:hypothetical protein